MRFTNDKSNWFDHGKTFLIFDLADNVSVPMYRCEVKRLIDGLTYRSYAEGYEDPPPQTWKTPAGRVIREKQRGMVVSPGCNREGWWSIFFQSVDIGIPYEATEALVAMLEARLAEPVDLDAEDEEAWGYEKTIASE